MASIAERAAGLLDSRDALEQALVGVQAEYPDLTRGGLNEAPGRETLTEAVDEIKAAIRYMDMCRESKGREANSYGMKHRAERWAGRYIANGSMIAAALVMGAEIRRLPHGSPNADIRIDEPRRCWRNSNCRGLIPKDSPDRICGNCRLRDTENPNVDHAAVFARERFWVWVGDRKAGENPRGDFIRDTRDLLSVDIDPGGRLLYGASEAMEEHDILWRRYSKENSIPASVASMYLYMDAGEDL